MLSGMSRTGRLEAGLGSKQDLALHLVGLSLSLSLMAWASGSWRASGSWDWTDPMRFRAKNFKTKLCTKFSAGVCLRGNHCMFAHGDADLRIIDDENVPERIL